MPVTHTTPQVTIYRTGQVKLSDLARRELLGTPAVVVVAPTVIGGRWLLLPMEQAGDGALTLYDDRGQKRFRSHALATAVFALLPTERKHAHLTLSPAPLGFWLLPSAGVPHKSEPLAQAA